MRITFRKKLQENTIVEMIKQNKGGAQKNRISFFMGEKRERKKTERNKFELEKKGGGEKRRKEKKKKKPRYSFYLNFHIAKTLKNLSTFPTFHASRFVGLSTNPR